MRHGRWIGHRQHSTVLVPCEICQQRHTYANHMSSSLVDRVKSDNKSQNLFYLRGKWLHVISIQTSSVALRWKLQCPKYLCNLYTVQPPDEWSNYMTKYFPMEEIVQRIDQQVAIGLWSEGTIVNSVKNKACWVTTIINGTSANRNITIIENGS